MRPLPVDPGSLPERGPASAAPRDIGFAPQPRVRWLAPGVLWRTARMVALSSVFGQYADRRELQAITGTDIIDLSGFDELWIDYAADTGDGFDAATTVASLLARETLDLDGHLSRAGSVLVWGGDLVYPAASAREYQDRLVGPYRSMLPWTRQPRLALAIPGNHDWYDGLTSFLRLFCQGRWIGGWKTVQLRSYFAVKLPHGWWLWGIDIQLDDDIDEPQLSYFRARAAELGEDDAVILCSAEPSWTEAGPANPEAYATLDFFERTVIGDRNRLRVSLTGDKHHYARYEGPEGQQKITAGGGGAYLSSTRHLRDELRLPPKESRDPGKGPEVPYRLRASYPSKPESRRLRRGVFSGIYGNGGFWAVPAVLYALVGIGVSRSLVNAGALVVTVVLVGLIGAALVAFTKVSGWRAWLLGVGHTAVHVGCALGAVALAWALASGSTRDLLAVGAAGALGALLGPLVVAAYLWVADSVGPHGVNSNELFAAQAREDHKSFLRLHLGRSGELTLYPVAVPRPARWRFAGPELGPTERWFEPDAEPVAELIEGPIAVSRRARRPAADDG